MAPFNMLDKISYSLVQGEILEILKTIEEKAIQEITAHEFTDLNPVSW